MDETTPYYGHWLKEFTFDNCAAGRKEYGEFLASFLAGENDGFVLNLNGKWGTGKTEFLKRLYTLFCKKNHPVLYIDAWESDFTDDPLLVVASELLNQIKEFLAVDGGDLDKIKQLLVKLLKGTAIVAGSWTGKALLDDAGAGREFVKQFTDEDAKKHFDAMKNDYSHQVKSIKEIRKELAQLAEALKDTQKMKLPVIVLVDELDRCRPSYAIEMLEVIKHFFSTQHFVFVVATDTEQLENSINAVYGEKFNSNIYLRRFFNRKIELAPPSIETFLTKYKFENVKNISLYPELPKGVDVIKYNLMLVTKAYELDLRTLDQIAAKLNACMRAIATKSDEHHVVNIFALIIAIVEFDDARDIFDARSTDNPFVMSSSSELKCPFRDFNFVSAVGDETIRFSQYYNFNMKHTVTYTVTREGDFGTPVDEQVYACNTRKHRLDRDKSTGFLLRVEGSIRSNMQKTNTTVWTWEQFRQLVKLSYTLN